MAVWFFLIVGKMKGHVGGGSGSGDFQGRWHSVKVKSFTVLICKHTLCIVQERLLEIAGASLEFHRGYVGHQLESLILAQNERWRHA